MSSAALVVGPRPSRDVAQTGYLYLAITHLATAAIIVAFAILASTAGSTSFEAFGPAAMSLPPAARDVVFVLLLLGFGTKAGAIPLHVWLPRAHPVAPSHVSALMSGVMIKAGIYGIVRFGARHPRPRTRVVGPARPRHRRDLGGARGALCADGARPEAPARVPQHREHRDHPDRRWDRAPRKRGRCYCPRKRGAHRCPVPYPQPRPVQVGSVPGVRLHPVGRWVARPQRPRWARPGDARHRPCVRHLRRGDQRPAATQWLRQRVADVPGPDRRGWRRRAVSRRPHRPPSWLSAVSG